MFVCFTLQGLPGPQGAIGPPGEKVGFLFFVLRQEKIITVSFKFQDFSNLFATHLLRLKISFIKCIIRQS